MIYVRLAVVVALLLGVVYALDKCSDTTELPAANAIENNLRQGLPQAAPAATNAPAAPPATTYAPAAPTGK